MAKPKTFGNPWTDEEIEKLLILKKQGKSYYQIGRILGRSEGAVTKKVFTIRRSTNKRSSRWTHEEIELLTALAETLPKTKLLTVYNQNATRKDYRKRSIAAISRKLFELGQSVKPQSGWYGTKAIAIGLGFSLPKIHSWLKLGLSHHTEGNRYYVRNDYLIAFILEHPTCLNGLSEDGLQWFLALLLEEKQMRGRNGRPEYTRALEA